MKTSINRRSPEHTIKNLSEKLLEAQKHAFSIRPQVGGFPVLAEVLRQEGAPLVTGTHQVPKFDRDALIAALRKDQKGLGSFPEFLQATWEAGVVSYDVDFIARKVAYNGANGESYIEEYPAVDLEK